jgi:glycosidase
LGANNALPETISPLRLDYIQSLGVGAIWLCPVYPSPFLDFGYDITDFRAIAPEMGTLGQFDERLHWLHANNIRLILDFVRNHTSAQHPWFVQSRSGRESAKRDWYILHDPR